MQFKTIQGIDVPEIGLGTYGLIGKQGEQIIKMALNMGYRHIDTAQDYKNEREVGNAIKQAHIKREELFVTTKIDRNNLEPEKLLKTAEQSLLDLDLSYVDLLLIHWPNPDYDIEKTMEAMLSFRDQGKALNIGVSNFPLKLLREVNEELAAPIFCNQVEYHPLLGQLDLLDYAADQDLLFTAYSPFGQGKLVNHPLLTKIGEKYGKSSTQVALRWLIEQEQVVAIPKASSKEHLEQNLDIYDFVLEDDDFYAIDDLDKTTRIINPGFAPEWD
ncbi:MAG: aldo/keto reductase [Balneolaceae bacterium]|nr:aldo/keto reductase [Balneolaceae bacterium]MBO6547779.1 aldo/keto reductase [Balneolaceae bacterium]MBO6648290.1 aldo/keto reductase [Balneolaceae bacterium]